MVIAKNLIKPYDETDMKSYTISRSANNARLERNTPDILQEVFYLELNELTLF